MAMESVVICQMLYSFLGSLLEQEYQNNWERKSKKCTIHQSNIALLYRIIIFDEFDTAFTQQDLYNIYELSKNTRACIILVGNKSDYMSQM